MNGLTIKRHVLYNTHSKVHIHMYVHIGFRSIGMGRGTAGNGRVW